jgi:hypothetical protein
MTESEMIQRALAGEKFTHEQWQQGRVNEMTARAEGYIKHLRDLEDPSIDPEPCGGMLCSCRPEFRPKRMR